MFSFPVRSTERMILAEPTTLQQEQVYSNKSNRFTVNMVDKSNRFTVNVVDKSNRFTVT